MTRKNTFAFLTVGLTSLLLSAADANAQRERHGGDIRCKEFREIAVNLSMALVKLGQAHVDRHNPLVRADEIRKIIATPYRVIPVKGLDRQARSTPGAALTELDIDKWEAMKNAVDRYTLVAHELLVLAKVESDGDYSVTPDFLQAVLPSKHTIGLKSSRHVLRADGSVSIEDPVFLDKDYGALGIDAGQFDFKFSKTSIDGVCRYLGFQKGIGGGSSSGLAQGAAPRLIALLDDQGQYVWVREQTPNNHALAMTYVICK